MQVPLLESQGDEETSHQEENEAICICRRHLLDGSDPEERKRHEGNQGGGGEVQGLRDPPGGHQKHHGCEMNALDREPFRQRKPEMADPQDHHESNRSHPEPSSRESAHFRCSSIRLRCPSRVLLNAC